MNDPINFLGLTEPGKAFVTSFTPQNTSEVISGSHMEVLYIMKQYLQNGEVLYEDFIQTQRQGKTGFYIFLCIWDTKNNKIVDSTKWSNNAILSV